MPPDQLTSYIGCFVDAGHRSTAFSHYSHVEVVGAGRVGVRKGALAAGANSGFTPGWGHTTSDTLRPAG